MWTEIDYKNKEGTSVNRSPFGRYVHVLQSIPFHNQSRKEFLFFEDFLSSRSSENNERVTKNTRKK